MDKDADSFKILFIPPDLSLQGGQWCSSKVLEFYYELTLCKA